MTMPNKDAGTSDISRISTTSWVSVKVSTSMATLNAMELYSRAGVFRMNVNPFLNKETNDSSPFPSCSSGIDRFDNPSSSKAEMRKDAASI